MLLTARLDATEAFPIRAGFDMEIRRAFGALRGISSQDRRKADRGARAEFERAESELREIRWQIAALVPPEIKTLADLIEQRTEIDASELSGMLLTDPAYRQPVDTVVSGSGASILAVLALAYLVLSRRSK